MISVLACLWPAAPTVTEETLLATQIHGTVRGGTGVRVSLLPQPTDHAWGRQILEGRRHDEPVVSAIAEATGRFSLEVPTPGVWIVVVEAPGFVPMRYSPVVLPPGLHSLELPPVTLYPDAGARVEVRTPEGKPVADAWVMASGADPGYWRNRVTDGWRLSLRVAGTGEDGLVHLPRGAEETLELQIFQPGRLRAETVTVGALGSVAVAGGDSLTSRWMEVQDGVRDQEGRPLAGVLVSLEESGWPLGLTGEDGRLCLRQRIGTPPPEVGLQLLGEDGRFATVALPRPTAEKPVSSFALPTRNPLRGRVLDAARRPLPQALVWVGPDAGTFALTDARGEYALPAGEREGLWVQIHAAGFVPRRVRLRPGDQTAWKVPTVALEAAAALGGKVVDGRGAPLAGVALAVEAVSRAGRPAAYHPDRAVGRGYSDARGRFTLSGLRSSPGSEAAYEVVATLPGFTPARLPLTGQETLQLVLRPSRGAFGRVIDIQEQPIPEVEVTVRRSGGDEAVKAVSDAEGGFEIAALPALTVDIEARGQGFAPLTVPGVEVATGEGKVELGTLVMIPGARLEGRVVNQAGKPLAEVEVWVLEDLERPLRREADRLRQQAPDGRSGDDGRFLLEGLAPGRAVHLLFHDEGYLPVWVQGARPHGDDEAAPEPLTAVLQVASSLRGRVVDVAGEVVARAQVSIYPQAPPAGTVGIAPRRSENSQRTVSDALGEFTFEELAPGSVQLVARAEGFLEMEAVTVTVTTSPNGAAGAGVELVLRRGAVVEGRVHNEAGEPVADARLRVGPARGFSDAEGAYRLVGAPLGVQALLLQHPEYRRHVQEIFVEPGANTFDVVVEDGWTVAGRVVDEDGTAVPGARIKLLRDSLRVPLTETTHTEADGRFRLVVSEPGRYTLAADHGEFASTTLENLEVTEEPLEDLEVVLNRGATIRGRVLGLEFEELAAVRIEAERAGAGEEASRTGSLDHAGEYTLAHLEPGDWEVRAALDGGRRQAEARVTITAETQEVERDLEFGRGLTLSGEARYQGLPVVAAHVSLIDDDTDTARRSVRTDHQGTFRLEDLEPARYRLDLLDPRRALSHVETVELAADRHLVLELESVPLTGKLVSAADGEPLEDVLVLVRKVGGSLTTLGTDAHGGFTVAHITPGAFRIEARKDGYTPADTTLTVAAGTPPEPVELALEPTAGLTLRLRLTSGEVPGLTTLSAFDPEGRRVLTDTRAPTDSGYTHFPLLPEGTWTLLVSTPGAAPTWETVTVPGPLVEVALPPAAPLTVRVPALAETPSPARLTVLGSDGRHVLRIGTDGEIRRQWPVIGGRATVADLPAGSWTILIEAADGRQWRAPTVTDGTELRVETLE